MKRMTLSVAAFAFVVAACAAVSVPSGIDAVVADFTADYELSGGTLRFDSAGTFTGSISGYGRVVNMTGAALDFSGASIAASGGTLELKSVRSLKKRYVRFTSLATRPNESWSGSGVAMIEFQLISNGEVLSWSGVSCTATTLSGNSFDASACRGFIDENLNSGNKSFLNAGNTEYYIVFDLGEAKEFDSYRWFAADQSGRDPYTWNIDVSDDGVNWTLVDSVSEYRHSDPLVRFYPSDTFPIFGRRPFFSGTCRVDVPLGTTLSLVDSTVELAGAGIAGGLHLVDAEAVLSGTSVFTGTADGYGKVSFSGVANGGTARDTAARTARHVRFTVIRDRGQSNVGGSVGYGWALSKFNLLRDGERIAYPAGTRVSLHSQNASKNEQYDSAVQSLLVDDNSALFFDTAIVTPIEIEMPEAVTFDGYSWWSRDDMPCRDPRSWRMEYSEDGEKWLLLEEVIYCGYEELDWNSAEMRNAEIYRKSFASSSLIVGMGDADYNATAVGEGVVYSPASDVEFSSEDELPGKDILFDGGSLTYTGLAPLTLSGYHFSGSGAFMTGAANLADLTLDVPEDAAFTFTSPNTVSARYYRFTVLETRPNTDFSGQGPQMCEIQLLNGSQVLTYSGASITASPDPVETPNLAGLIDNNVQDGNKCFYRIDSGTTPVVFTVDLGSEQQFGAYRFKAGNDAPGRDPYSWRFEISTDGVNWIKLHEVSAYRGDGDPLDRNAYTETFPLVATSSVEVTAGEIAGRVTAEDCDLTIGGSAAFTGTIGGNAPIAFDGVAMNGLVSLSTMQKCRYCRFTSLAVRPDAQYSNQGPQMSEIVLFRNGEPLSYNTLKATCVASGNGDMQVNALVDNNINSKAFINVGSGTRAVTFTIDIGEEMEFDGYGFYSGNDGTGRDPVSWLFEVSDDGNAWTLVDSQSDRTDLPLDRNSLIFSTTFSNLAKDSLADDTELQLGADGSLSLDGVSETVGGLSGAGAVTLSNGGVLTIAGSTQEEPFSGTITGSGTVVVDGGRWVVRKAQIGDDVTVTCVNGGRVVDQNRGFVILVK